MEYTDDELLRRAVLALSKSRGNKPRWVYIKNAFALGAGSSRELCRRFNIDPWLEHAPA